MGCTAPGPPRLAASAAVNGSLTGHGNVGGLEGIDAGRQVEALQSFPRRLDDGIQLWFEGELQHGSFLNMQVDMALQADGSREEGLTGRHNDTSAALCRAFVDGLLDSFLVLRRRSVGLCAKRGNHIVLATDLRLPDALFYLPILRLVPAYSMAQQGKKQT